MTDGSKTADAVFAVAKDVATSVANGGSLVSAVAAGALAVAPFVGSTLIVQAVKKRTQRKTELWMEHLAFCLKHKSAAAAEQALLDQLDTPDSEWAQDAVFEAARAIFDNIDVACVPYLARLSASQFEAKQVDRRDRRLLALLRDLEHASLLAFQSLLARALPFVRAGANAEISIFQPGSNPPMVFPEECAGGWRMWIRAEGEEIYQGEVYTTYCAHDAERFVLATACTHGLISKGMNRIGASENYIVDSAMLVDYLWPRLRPIEKHGP